jgi:hypothetical protein
MSTAPDNPPELAPSATAAEPPTVSRVFGLAGLFAAVAGGVTLVAKSYDRGILPEGAGYLLALFGVLGMLVHAARDGDVEVRRLYGLFAAVLLVVAVVVGFYPGGPGRAVGALFLPWGAGAALVSLLFLVPFTRHETDEPYRGAAVNALQLVGAAAALGAVVGGLLKPDFLIGPGLALAVLGVGFLGAFLTTTDPNVGRGFRAAVGLGALGALALAVGLGRSVVPTVLFDGPNALRTPLQALDPWKVLARGFVIALGLGIASFALRRSTPLWLKGILAVAGLAVAGVFVWGSFASPIKDPPAAYLVPYGLALSLIGLLYLGLSLGTVSDAPFVVLMRRELAAYFTSPIAYLVLFGAAVVAGLGYLNFLSELSRGPLPEPVVAVYSSLTILAAFQVVFLVPAVTMRLFAEERRTGTLEVLLTAPVDEPVIVLSKFVAAWLFYLLSWLPALAFLVALRTAGGAAFEYQPVVSHMLAVAATGAGFVGMGLFFSSLTRNQVVAAVLTFAGMMFLLLTVWLQSNDRLAGGLQAVAGRVSYWNLWQQALAGQLPVAGVVVYLSLGVFWTFLTVKVLEARRWT